MSDTGKGLLFFGLAALWIVFLISLMLMRSEIIALYCAYFGGC